MLVEPFYLMAIIQHVTSDDAILGIIGRKRYILHPLAGTNPLSRVILPVRLEATVPKAKRLVHSPF